jgi:hypothetical protein
MKEREKLRVVLVRFLRKGEMVRERERVPSPSVRSYCAAMRLCWSGQAPEGVLVSRESISVCKWCAAALGLKPRQNQLEQKLEPAAPTDYDAVYLYSPTAGPAGRELPSLARNPDVAIVIGTGPDITSIVGTMRQEDLALQYEGDLTASALSTMVPRQPASAATRVRWAAKRASIAVLSWLFSTPLVSNKASIAVLTQPFKSYAFSRVADPVIRLTMAGASACLNSSMIPLVTGKTNTSFICPGGMLWAGLKARHRLLGMPMGMYRTMEHRLMTAATA